MPVNPAYVNPMLDPFRNMVKDVESKSLHGPDVDKLKQMMAKMEQLAREMDDIAAYSTKLANENYFLDFGNLYSKLLQQAAAKCCEARWLMDS